jgi:ABC-type transport system involved in multi-copper enzyme maturation permease subunit
VVNVATLLIGPLAGPECRRALARGWLILVRALAAAALLGVAMLALWAWWINQRIDQFHQPFLEFWIGLRVIEGMLLTIALVLTPAVLAGSLAGDRERGALALLLTTRVTAAEIVAGRLAGKLAQVGTILLAGVPALVMIAALAGFTPLRIGVYLLLPASVAVGAGGLSALASTLSRRGRDALLAVYLIELFLMLVPMLAVQLGVASATDHFLVAAPNPFVCLSVSREEVGLAFESIGFWLAIGLAGAGLASWRLRPSCLAPTDGERVVTARGGRGFVPPVDEARPMVWKELFVERVVTLGRFGRWLGLGLVVALIGGSLGLSAVIAWDVYRPGDPAWADWARNQLGIWVGGSGTWLCCLIQWAIGLRAAVSISSERERGTWDALLTSPLNGREIVRGKLWGSYFAIRGLVFAALVAWILAAGSGAIPVRDAVRWSAAVLFVGLFMAAVGVRTSLACQTAARAMSLTIGIWLGAFVVVSVAAFIALAVSVLVLNAAWLAAAQLGLAPPPPTFWAPLPMYVAWPLATNSVYLLATLLVVADTRLRFDRIAGRMTEGKLAVAFEELVYGRPEAPVPLEEAEGEPFDELLPTDARPGPAPLPDGDAVAGSA